MSKEYVKFKGEGKGQKVKEWVCDACGYAAALKDMLIEHVYKIHFKIKSFKCEECQFVASNSKSLTRHVKKNHL